MAAIGLVAAIGFTLVPYLLIRKLLLKNVSEKFLLPLKGEEIRAVNIISSALWK